MSSPALHRRTDRRSFWLMGSLLVAVTSCVLALGYQEVRPNPFAPRSTWDTFFQPWEYNPQARFPTFDGAILGMDVSADGRTIWLVGAKRFVAVSRDAGRTWDTWEKKRLPTFQGEGSTPAPAQAPEGPGVAEPKKDDTPRKSKAFQPPLGTHVFAQGKPVPANELKPAPVNAEANRLVGPPVGSALRAISFEPDGKEGWIVGMNGVLFTTTDSGTTWTALRLDVATVPNNLHLLAVRAYGKGKATVVDHLGCRFDYTSPTATPKRYPQLLPTEGAYIEADNTYLAGWNGTHDKAEGYVRIWPNDATQPQDSSIGSAKLYQIARAGDGPLWAVGELGTLRVQRGDKWELQPKLTVAHHLREEGEPQPAWDASPKNPPHWRAIAFADAQRGVVVGSNLGMAYTIDGNNWQPSTFVLPANSKYRFWPPEDFTPTVAPADYRVLRTVALRGNDGWAAGTDGLLLRTHDAGRTWYPFTSPLNVTGQAYFLPALWFPFALFIAALMLVPAFKTPEPPTTDGIADKLVADRPLEPGDTDVLELGKIAKALSAFIRNEKTLPPLTSAVTGKWGTGKSSLMNLLAKDLRQYGFCPVWFNAWHHSTQKEDQLLAGLLAHIIRQGVPASMSWEGVVYRWRLFWRRAAKIWFRLLVGLTCIALSLALFWPKWAKSEDPLKQAGESITKLFSSKWTEELAKKPQENGYFMALSGLSGAFVFGRSVVQSLRSFGVDAGTLLAPVASRATLADLDAKAGFNLTFARQFKEVTTALNPRTLVVFIDDLDRCQPQNILQVMEAINFLATSGDCYIFVGMDRDYVQRGVALGFASVAELMEYEQVDPADPHAKKLVFAKRYLEKLINFEVPIPTPDNAKRKEFLLDPASVTPDTPPSPTSPPVTVPPRSYRERFGAFVQSRWRALRDIVPVGFKVVLLVCVPLLAYNLMKVTSMPPLVAVADTSVGSSTGPKTIKDPANADDTPLPPPNPDTVMVPREAGDNWALAALSILCCGALLGIGIRGVLLQPTVEVKDSPNFTKAMNLWLDLVTTKRLTARGLKQFLNRMRFLAMRMNPPPESPTRGARLWQRLFGPHAAPVTTQVPNPSPAESKSILDAYIVYWSTLLELYGPALADAKNPHPQCAIMEAKHKELFKLTADEEKQQQARFAALVEEFRT